MATVTIYRTDGSSETTKPPSQWMGAFPHALRKLADVVVVVPRRLV
jgi:hypothetical protein